jgi:aminopeptidase N
MFPCFDQPDLKATFQLTARVPKDWTVITSVLPTSTTSDGEATQVWNFPESKLFSTYIFSMHAGPYHQWSDPAAKIPSRLFARKSLAKYVRPEEWFQPTRQGFEFFQTFFGIPYPFAKYDQVIVPDFNSGAMENVAAVTFSERYIPRGTETIQDREDRAEVILHEMAHMWFGNLVTMKWWDDLWLNESFATYMASKALFEATEFKSAWQSFYSDMKQWAYWEDQLVTTHPILADVPNTEAAFANFDGITYGKGAAVLKQLDRLLGADGFQKGVSEYLKRHSYENATLADFIGSLSQESKVELGKWSQQWLQSAGLNSISVKYQCDDKGKITDFALNQSPSSVSNLHRTHKTVVGLFGKDLTGNIVEKRNIAVTYNSATTQIPELKGEECPLLVYPNYQDHDYVRVSLDQVSVHTAKTSLANFPDNFLRAMLWQSLWDMTRDAELPVLEYAEVAFNQLGRESDIRIVSSVMNNLHGEWPSSSSVVSYLPDSTDEEKKLSFAFRARLEEFAFQKLNQATAGSDLQRVWFESAIKASFTNTGLERLAGILEGQAPARGLDLDQDLRWLIVRQLSMMGHPRTEALISKEQTKDPSSRGKQSALAAQAMMPALQNKRKWFELVSTEKPKLTLAEQKSVIWNLFPSVQRSVRTEFQEDYFKRLKRLAAVREVQFVETYASSLAPTHCDQSSVNRLAAEIQSISSKANPIIFRELRIAHQEDERCVKILQKAKEMVNVPSSKKI